MISAVIDSIYHLKPTPGPLFHSSDERSISGSSFIRDPQRRILKR